MSNGKSGSTNESKCVLAATCKLAGNPDACHDRCPHFNALHAPAGRHSNAQMPPEYQYYTVANNPVRDAQPAVYKLVDQYVLTFARMFTDERIKSLYLYSESPGTGKTSTACAILNAYITAHYVGSIKRDQQPEQRPAYFASVNDLQHTYNNMTRPGGREAQESAGNEYRRELTRLKNTQIVVLDDMAVRSYTEQFLADIHGLIDKRTTAGMPTIFTSNVSIDELKEVFKIADPKGRTFDRVRGYAFELAFEGESKRKA